MFSERSPWLPAAWREGLGPQETQQEVAPSVGDRWVGTDSGRSAEGLGRGLGVGMGQKGVIWYH